MNRTQLRKIAVLAVCVAGALSGCGGDSSKPNTPTPTPAPVVPQSQVGTVTGKVIDANTGTPIQGVTVFVAGLAVATTAQDGTFTVSNVAVGERVVVSLKANTHAEAAEIIRVDTNAETSLEARMVKLAVNGSFVGGTGGRVADSVTGASVSIPSSAVVSSTGAAYTGTVNVGLAPIDPASDSSTMPGDFTAAQGPIESFGALNVQLRSNTGEQLNLKPGALATIQIPVATRSPTTPSTIPLFYFNQATGLWVQEGTATLITVAGKTFYQGTVGHFSTWNADSLYSSVTVNGCVEDVNGNKVSGAQVASDGIDYSGTSSAASDASGNFSIKIKTNGLATLRATKNSILSNAYRAGPYASTQTLPQCLVIGDVSTNLTFTLTWGAAPDDLDSYLFTPSGQYIFYGSPSIADGNLDVDDTSSYGPEVVTLTKLEVGTYRYFVNDFTGSGTLSASGAKVVLQGANIATQIASVPGGSGSNDWWELFNIVVDARCNITVTRTNIFTSGEPTPAMSAQPVYCSRRTPR